MVSAPSLTYVDHYYDNLILIASSKSITFIKVGDKVAFCGNKIIIQHKLVIDKTVYVYTVYQVLTKQEYKNKKWIIRHRIYFDKIRKNFVFRNVQL